jgi:hypothetical protein
MAPDPVPPVTKGSGKRPYTPPRLELYGDVREIASAAGMTSAVADGAVHGMTKTS